MSGIHESALGQPIDWSRGFGCREGFPFFPFFFLLLGHFFLGIQTFKKWASLAGSRIVFVDNEDSGKILGCSEKYVCDVEVYRNSKIFPE